MLNWIGDLLLLFFSFLSNLHYFLWSLDISLISLIHHSSVIVFIYNTHFLGNCNLSRRPWGEKDSATYISLHDLWCAFFCFSKSKQRVGGPKEETRKSWSFHFTFLTICLKLSGTICVYFDWCFNSSYNTLFHLSCSSFFHIQKNYFGILNVIPSK